MLAIALNAGRKFLLSLMLGTCCGVVAGGAGAAFARGLSLAARERETHTAFVWLLPLGGWALGWLLERYGADAIQGTQRIARAWQQQEQPLPWHMAPVVFAASIGTHLFGGSAGREGAAVQLGACVGDVIAAPFSASLAWRRQAMVAGMAGAFAAVFGTPIAALLFALECLQIRHLQKRTLLSGLVASEIGQRVAHGLGVRHPSFVPLESAAWQPMVLKQWLLFAGAAALLATCFVFGLHVTQRLAQALCPQRPLRMALGGAILVGLWQIFGDLYLGLGDTLLSRSFNDTQLPVYSFFIKGIFTVVTLGFGFAGGEVTPLFCLGASLGNALSGPLGLPLHVVAAIGTFSVFAAAAKTPLSLAVMAAEMFGLHALLPALVVHTSACALRGRSPSIYEAARRIICGTPTQDEGMRSKGRGVSPQ